MLVNGRGDLAPTITDSFTYYIYVNTPESTRKKLRYYKPKCVSPNIIENCESSPAASGQALSLPSLLLDAVIGSGAVCAVAFCNLLIGATGCVVNIYYPILEFRLDRQTIFFIYHDKGSIQLINNIGDIYLAFFFPGLKSVA